MTTNRASELLYDTASTLRLLDAELGELAPRRAPETAVVPAAVPPAVAPAAPEIGPTETVLPMLPGLLLRAMVEVHAMLHSIRAERDQIRAATSERLAHTSEKLNEVSSATACGELDIMDSIHRAMARVDDLESPAVAADPEKGAVIRSELRDELLAVMGHMQFQDITSQQIMHVQSLLAEMEQRLTEIANLFDPQSGERVTPSSIPTRPARVAPDAQSFDPNATLDNAATRQALADALVGGGVSRA